jgi:aminopeptidase N
MRHARWWFAALLLCGPGAPPAAAIDPFFPEYGNDGYDVGHYNIVLDVDNETGKVNGRAVITARATTRLTSFAFDLGRFNVRAVRVNGVSASFDHRRGKLHVRPSTPLPAHAGFEVAVAYDGVPRSLEDPTYPPPVPPEGQLGWQRFEDTSYVVSEPIGASTWFPVNDEPTDKASYRISVTVDEPYIAVANGVLRRVTDLGDRRRFVWEQRQPMASWLAIVDVDHFNVSLQRASNGVLIRNHTLDANTPDQLAALRKVPAMMRLFETYAGPYPFDGYGSVIIEDPALYYALETQGMSTFPVDFVNEAVVAHELAHQWFGNSVSVAQWRDLWLAEGFATYLEFLWEFRGNRPGLEAEMRDLHDFVVDERVGPAVVDSPFDMFTSRTYERGALALHSLRLTVGDRAFFDTLRTWQRRYKGGNATSADFIRTAVEVSGNASVRRLLRAWLYEEPVPPLPGTAATALVARSAADIEALRERFRFRRR